MAAAQSWMHRATHEVIERHLRPAPAGIADEQPSKSGPRIACKRFPALHTVSGACAQTRCFNRKWSNRPLNVVQGTRAGVDWRVLACHPSKEASLHTRVPLACALVLLLIACVRTPEMSRMPASDQPTDEQAIRDLYARWFGAMESGDIEGFLALVADDFVLKSPGSPPVTDRTMLRAGLEQFHAAFSEDVEYRIEELHVAGPWAWVRITERATLTPKSGGENRVLSGTHLGILVRQADGRWRVARDVSSFDQPI